MTTILICGSRDWRAARHIREVLETYQRVVEPDADAE